MDNRKSDNATLRDTYEKRGLRLKKGDIITPTDMAIEDGIIKCTCVEYKMHGFCNDGRCILVKKGGNKHPSSYWAGFWKKKKNNPKQ